MMYCGFLKRFLDFWIALFALTFLSPILLIVALSLYLSNKGAGVFFQQERPGKGAKIFKIVKFKSMSDKRDIEGNLLPNEQRITPVGRFIRSTSIDELPQLYNILKGDMSLVGPRPLMIRYLELYNPKQARRHEVRPGITGWAQVKGRNTITWTKKFELDVWYVDNLSFLLDLKIIFLTIRNVIMRKDINSSEKQVGAVGFDGTN